MSAATRTAQAAQAPTAPTLLRSTAPLEDSALCRTVHCTNKFVVPFGRVQAEDFLTDGGILNITRIRATGQLASSLTANSAMEPQPLDRRSEEVTQLFVQAFTGRPWTAAMARDCQKDGDSFEITGTTVQGSPYVLECVHVDTARIVSIRDLELDTSYDF
ncbi:hypothetical protein [Deinococcus piscis]|uniref:hypothetical protein n=1 Tax=Deinococcus piscis TaxID=394230 RepID=UPI001676CF94|nr:hypothetical protein [Deinococcus piscis]